MSVRHRASLVSPDGTLSIIRQCDVLSLSRSSYYYDPKEPVQDTDLMNEIHDIWLQDMSLGYRRVTVYLEKAKGIKVNKKRVQRLMKLMGIKSCLPASGHRTTIPNDKNAVRPYLLRNLEINWLNQVWATDITYIKLPTGMVYLFAIIDWHTRYIVAWKLANTMEACHAVEVLEEALKVGKPEIMNSDQGSQFTGKDWIMACEFNGIKVSHDGVGRCIDNIRIERFWWSIKYEHVHIYCYETMSDLDKGIRGYIHYYNTKRYHQALEYKTPAMLYLAA